MKQKYISMARVAKLGLVPWAVDRHTLARYFREGLIRSITLPGKNKGRRYLTTKEWVEKYVHKVQTVTK